MRQPRCRGRNADKGLSDSMECIVGEQRGFYGKWLEQLQRRNLLEGYQAKKFIKYINRVESLKEMDTDFILKTLGHIKVFWDGTLLLVFLDGTKIECK